MSQSDDSAIMNGATGLIRYDAMINAIAAAYDIDEVKDIRDKAVAIAAYAKQAKNFEAERQAVCIRLRGEKKCGQLLATMEKAKGAAGNPGGRGAPIVPSNDTRAQKTLSDLGISYDQSSLWQKTYKRVGRELMSDLQAICSICHSERHYNKRR